MNYEQIARVAHEVNRAYCQAIGDDSQAPWETAPSWQQESEMCGVAFIHGNPDATPEDSHKSWLKGKVEDGWSYGKVKNEKKKKHPCFVAYGELPLEQRVKDHLFGAVVRSLL